MASERARAIAIIQEDIEIHRKWRDYIRDNPEAQEPRPQAETAGDVAHHERWIERLETVLRVLKVDFPHTGD